jgi:predicted transcriptional regulator of viral defense system
MDLKRLPRGDIRGSDKTSADIYKCRPFVHTDCVTNREKALELLHSHGLLRPRDLAEAGLRGAVLWELAREGVVERVGRGLYRLGGVDVTENVSLAEVAKAVPGGVICLLTALAFHELTTQLPHKVWIAVDRKARKPKARTVELEIFRFSGQGLVEGVEVHRIEGVPVRITNPARTVADCFKYRNKVGLDVAMEALRDCLHDRKAAVDELVRFAKLDRVWNVMRPYMEATV